MGPADRGMVYEDTRSNVKSRFVLMCTLCLCAVLLAPCLSHAQGLGTINGTITDRAAARYPAPKSQQRKPHQASCAMPTQLRRLFRHSFSFSGELSPGITATGFKSESEDVIVLADQSLTVNFHYRSAPRGVSDGYGHGANC